MSKLSKIILLLILVSLFIPILPAQAAGAIFRLTSAKTDYYVGENVYIDIIVEPNGAAINTVRLISDFTNIPAAPGGKVLSIKDFNLSTAWPNQSPGKVLDDANSHINVGGFILVDSVSTNSKFGTLIFKANAVGSSTINFATGSHLISPDQVEMLNLGGSFNITINVLGAPPQPNRAPVFDPVGNKTIDLGQTVSFHVRSSDPDGDNVTLTTDIPADAIISNITTGPVAEGDFNWTPTANGSYTLKFYGTDDNSTGAKTGSLAVTVNVSVPVPPANHAPIFQPVGNKSINLGAGVSFHVQATDPEGDLVNLTWTIPAGATFTNVVNNAVVVSGDFSWTPGAEGVYTASFNAQDNHPTDPKNSNLAVSIGVSVPPNHAPVFETIAEKTINAGEILTFNVSATDPDGDNVSLSSEPLETASLTPISNGITSTSRFTWTPKNFGVYYAVFKARDNNANPLESSQAVRITVFGGQCPPCGGGGGGGNSCPIPQCQKQEFEQPLKKSLPAISSPTHLSQETWYSNNTPQFVWDVAEQNLGYTFNIDQNPLSDPAIGYFFSQDKVFSFSKLTDGFWYFHLKVKYSDGYGPTAHYQVKIDNTAPEFFKPSIEGDKIYFSAIDNHSGLAYFEMKLDEGPWQKVQSPYTFSEADKNGKIMTLRAVDNAGNVIEAGIDLPKMAVIIAEQKKYIINRPEFVVAAPIIDKVEFPLIRGRAQTGAKVYLFISSVPQTIIYTLADYNGNWLAYADKILTPGKYSIYGIANVNFIDSAPSEKVYFNISKVLKLAPRFSAWYLWIILLLVLLTVLLSCMYLLKKIKENPITKNMLRQVYKEGNADGRNKTRLEIIDRFIKHAKKKKE
ncbi:MAG: hypothetical protein NTX82_06900 [Candidatus Parcubacteria bacterium]|nr:hypothetical protein [Candidatus Parcubacteria bacterium]